MKLCSNTKFQRSLTGKGFAGVVIDDPELDQLTTTIIKELKWKGPFELEFLKTHDSEHTLFEINPRFPAWVDFPSQIGCNLPVRLLEDLLGMETTPLQTCTVGQMFIRHCVDIVGDIAELADMSTTGMRNITPSRSSIEVVE